MQMISLHGKTSDNGFRQVPFAAAQNTIISCISFQHRHIQKTTCQSPDLNTKNQIDHTMIDGRHASSILDVRSVRCANMDSSHFLVAAKVRTRLCARNNTCCDQKSFLNRSLLAFRNSFMMLFQIPTSIRSVNTLLTPCTLQLRKSLDTVNSRSNMVRRRISAGSN